jgi:hypothetical protein
MASNLLEVIFVTKKVQRQANQRAHLAPKWDVAHNSFVFFSFFLFVASSPSFCIA